MSKSNRNWRISQLKISINSGRWNSIQNTYARSLFHSNRSGVVLFCLPRRSIEKKNRNESVPPQIYTKDKKKSLIKLISNTDFWSASKMMIKYKEKLLFTPKVIYQAFRIYWKLYFLSSPWGIYSLTAI